MAWVARRLAVAAPVGSGGRLHALEQAVHLGMRAIRGGCAFRCMWLFKWRSGGREPGQEPRVEGCAGEKRDE